MREPGFAHPLCLQQGTAFHSNLKSYLTGSLYLNVSLKTMLTGRSSTYRCHLKACAGDAVNERPGWSVDAVWLIEGSEQHRNWYGSPGGPCVAGPVWPVLGEHGWLAVSAVRGYNNIINGILKTRGLFIRALSPHCFLLPTMRVVFT